MKWEIISKYVGNSIKREENMKWEKQNFKSKTIQHAPVIWCTYLQSFKKKTTAMSYSAKTKCDRQTDGWTDRQTGAFQYLPSRTLRCCGLVCWSLTSLCRSNGHIETMPAREINPFTVLPWPWFDPSFSGHNDRRAIISEWTRLRFRPLSHRGWRSVLWEIQI